MLQVKWWPTGQLPTTKRGLATFIEPRTQYNIERSIEHEHKHLDIWFDFIDYWNNEINNLGLFKTYEDAKDAGEKLIEAFNESYTRTKEEQRTHCPQFINDDLYRINGCGLEFANGIRKCK